MQKRSALFWRAGRFSVSRQAMLVSERTQGKALANPSYSRPGRNTFPTSGQTGRGMERVAEKTLCSNGVFLLPEPSHAPRGFLSRGVRCRAVLPVTRQGSSVSFKIGDVLFPRGSVPILGGSLSTPQKRHCFRFQRDAVFYSWWHRHDMLPKEKGRPKGAAPVSALSKSLT